MPYIKSEDKKKFEPQVKELRMIIEILNSKGEISKGDLTYLVYAFGLSYFKGRESYTNISSAISCLIDAAEEIRRRHLNPYENEKIKSHGDVE